MRDLKDIELFLLDMDGTFYLGNKLLPGSIEFVDTLRKQGKNFMFLTNNSSNDSESYAEKLRKMGLDGKIEVFTSGDATGIFLKERYGTLRIFLVGTKKLAKTFEKYGHKIVQEDPEIVVLGYDTEINYEKLAKACIYLRKNLLYVATHPDINCPSLEGPLPDAGSYIALIEKSTGRLPDYIVGKPNPLMLEMVMKKTGVSREKIAMVGDRLYTDIEFARRSGILSILVLTGETTLEDLRNSSIKPDIVVENIGELAKLLQKESGE
ncbi:HAD-superfamily hydrolase, subfamily IIA [Pseudothermotoga thermarum DSM 5069]|uniref:HAD-superfamily hydrolase, subfamily IIA n=1 Tax=Pseudothermotoga thermarum DSM 5069 TaxID=688269 RepID=F7YVB9_9THEM|nr:HAD-superfamily hydrolase, subfamily IIA [Pseudothermotoga thermarum DSM 5069]